MAQLQLLKTVKNAKLFTDGTQKLIMLERVRISFPAIGHMKEEEGDDGSISRKFKASAMLPFETHEEAKDLFVELMNELLKTNDAKVANENRCIKKHGDDSDREEYQGHWVVSASESRRPAARDSKGKLYFDAKLIKDGAEAEAIFDQIDEVFYGGVWVNILLRPWYFNGKVKGKAKTFPKRICAGLTGIQFFKDDTPFGNGRIDDANAWSSSEDEGSEGGGMDGDDDGL
jgi:hypothetical protein